MVKNFTDLTGRKAIVTGAARDSAAEWRKA